MTRRLLFCHLKNDHPLHASTYNRDRSANVKNELLKFPNSLGILMEIAYRESIPFDYYDTYVSGTTQDFLKDYAKTQQDVILLSAIAGNYTIQFLNDLCLNLKAINREVTIVLGGPIASIYPQILMELVPIDILVVGEGEKTFMDLVHSDFSLDDIGTLKGIVYRKGEEIITNPSREPLPNPLELETCNAFFEAPQLKHAIGAYVEQQKRLNRGWEFSGSRGCYANCTFCKKVFHKPLRYFSADYIVDFMERVYKIYGLKRFSFLDENFIGYSKNFKQFLKLLEKSDVDFRWRIRSRMDCTPFELLDEMKQLGLISIGMGIEHADQGILDYFNKSIIIADFTENIKKAAADKLVYAAFILGAPNETEESIQKVVDFVKYTGITYDRIDASFLSVIPGTKIFDDMVASGMIKSIKQYLCDYVGRFRVLEMNLTNLPDVKLIEGRDAIMKAAKHNLKKWEMQNP